jgi:branched-chain amino acid transport system substrate-binding protein
MKTVLAFFVSLAGLVASAPCAVADDAATYDLLAAYALTGFASSYGSAELNATNLAIAEFNRVSDLDGKKVKLIVEDTQSSNAHTLSALRRLMSVNKAKLILGPTWLDSFQSALPVVDREKIVVFTPSAAVAVLKRSDGQYPFVFSTWYNLELGVELLLKHVQAQQKKRLVLLFDEDPYFQKAREIVKRKASSLGLEVLADESLSLGGADFRSMFVKTRKMDVDGAVFGLADENSLLAFMKQRKELNPSLQLYGFEYLDGYVSQEKWVELFDNLDFISPQVHDKSFALEYQKQYNTLPTMSAATAYDATKILLQALKAGKRTPEEVREYLLSNEFKTAMFGAVRFNSAGGVRSGDFEIKKVRGKVVTQLPAPVAVQSAKD